jgi:hypothetical protein
MLVRGVTRMINPWNKIALSDYEEHMKSSGVYQLQTLNEIMKKQFDSYPIKTIAILGVAGGNGLEHIDTTKINKVYGIDINENYLHFCKERYKNLDKHIELLRLDLSDNDTVIPRVDLIIADLFIEYIGLESFSNHLLKSKPTFVSCVIQRNDGTEFVSSSPYEKAFSEITAIHTDIDKDGLVAKMESINMNLIYCEEILLPNKKVFIRLDFRI